MAEKFWTHLKLKNGDKVKFIPPAPDGDKLGGITQEERESIADAKSEISQLQAGKANKSDVPSDEHINNLIDTALGVVENGYY